MIDLLDFVEDPAPIDPPIYNNQEVPKEMNIFCRSEESFLPQGKTLNDLTPEELKLLQMRYKFSYFIPGEYQSITYIGDTSPS